jgi:hypothetical protein
MSNRALSVHGALLLLAVLSSIPAASASHIPGAPCTGCADHTAWPTINGKLKKIHGGSGQLVGTRKSDELSGHHGSDVLSGRRSSDVLWGDWDPAAGQPTGQHDLIYGGAGNDFIYGSHGHNRIYGGKGNDAISVHYGRGLVDCGPGRDIYHVPRSNKKAYRFVHCEKVDYRSERQRGHGLRPLP